VKRGYPENHRILRGSRIEATVDNTQSSTGHFWRDRKPRLPERLKDSKSSYVRTYLRVLFGPCVHVCTLKFVSTLEDLLHLSNSGGFGK